MFIMRIRIELWYLDDNIDVYDGGRGIPMQWQQFCIATKQCIFTVY